MRKLLSIFLVFVICFTFSAPFVSATAIPGPGIAPMTLGEFLSGSTNATLAAGLNKEDDIASEFMSNVETGTINFNSADKLKLLSCTSLTDLVKIGFNYRNAEKAVALHQKYLDMNAHYTGLLAKLKADAEKAEDAAKKAEIQRQAEVAERDIDLSAYYTLNANSESAAVIQNAITALGGVKVNIDYLNRAIFTIGQQELGSLISDDLKKYFTSATGKTFGYFGTVGINDYGIYPGLKFDKDVVSSELKQFLGSIKTVSADAFQNIKLLHISYTGMWATGVKPMTEPKADYVPFFLTSAYKMHKTYKTTNIGDGWMVDTPIFLYCKSNDINISYTNEYSKNDVGGLWITSSSNSPIYYLLPGYAYDSPAGYFNFCSTSPRVGVSNLGKLGLVVPNTITSRNVADYVTTYPTAVSVPQVVPKISIVPFIINSSIVGDKVDIDDYILDKDKIFAPVISGQIAIGDNVIDVPLDGVNDDDRVVGEIDLTDITDAIEALPTEKFMEKQKHTQLDFTPLKVSFADRFPFCLPFDLYNAFSSFLATPEVPKFEVNFDKGLVGKASFIIDFTPFTNVASILRYFILLGFVVFLVQKTRDLIGG